MAGALFSFVNHFDASTFLSTPPNLSPSTPLNNLKDRRLALTVRTNDNKANPLTLRIDLGSPKKIDILGIFGLNIKSSITNGGASLFVNAGTVPDGNDVINGAILGSPYFPDRTPIGLPGNVFWAINDNGIIGKTARYWSVSVFVTTTDNYYELGRVWMGASIILPNGVDNEWSQTIKDPSVLSRSRGQQVYADVKRRYRKTNISAGSINQKTMFGDPSIDPMPQNFQEMFFTAGMTGEIVVLPRSGNNSSADYQFLNRTGMYGVISDEVTIRKQAGDNYQFDLTIEECL